MDELKRKILLIRYIAPIMIKHEKIRKTFRDYLRIVVFGDEAVGKSSIILRFIEGEFKEWDPTVEDFHLKSVKFGNSTTNLDILGVAGQMEHNSHSIRNGYLSQCDCYLGVCSATIKNSMNYIEENIQDLNNSKDGPYTPIIVVLNKMDLIENDINDSSDRK
ncbi:predicted protein [Naegleria gruberi]|uniref:Predicted protein n=1 Tax=Naegleria gruberi TaxID=5762 RepID=D2VI54_NAEGR|nr:uncharacterized protein NAEGRDRAFT_68567 [Naegleria gruberi]EFC43456.1 predicted protein [Naegleria gruberi]|eukprot:XP_002676200.1 predicted protein [Naegleria gruberi strain NEG-M]